MIKSKTSFSQYIISVCFCLGGLVLLSNKLQAQNEREKYYNLNLPNFDYRKYHFGFILGVNQSDFILTRKFDPNFTNKVIILKNERQPGFNLGIVSSYKLSTNVRIRFVPSLSFQDRKLTYTFEGSPDSTVTFEKIVEATFVEFPFYVKLRTNRIGNFAGYAIGGAKFMLDMTSKKIEDFTADKDVLVRTKKQQVALEFGGGADFFLPYFKFGIELKMFVGFGNVLIDDRTRFTAPIDALRSKGYLLTFTFEG